MKNMTLKLMLVAFALGFGIFFGVDIATKSHEKTTAAAETAVSAPARPIGAAADAKQAVPPAPRPEKTVRPEPPRLSEQGMPMPDSFLNKLSNKIGDAFRHLAKWIVGLLLAVLESILG